MVTDAKENQAADLRNSPDTPETLPAYASHVTLRASKNLQERAAEGNRQPNFDYRQQGPHHHDQPYFGGREMDLSRRGNSSFGDEYDSEGDDSFEEGIEAKRDFEILKPGSRSS
ncbi:hypothetical protein BYT27DRAFT_7253380 [Phlegmacium glaucopus]|nr:hypothetical protein BYT27DRAFT_7253380 [Phlegmacium glaucopus]